MPLKIENLGALGPLAPLRGWIGMQTTRGEVQQPAQALNDRADVVEVISELASDAIGLAVFEVEFAGQRDFIARLKFAQKPYPGFEVNRSEPILDQRLHIDAGAAQARPERVVGEVEVRCSGQVSLRVAVKQAHRQRRPKP